MDTSKPERRLTVRQRLFEILEHSRRRDFASRVSDFILVVLIVSNVAIVVAQSVPEVAAKYGASLYAFDRFCVIIFAIEYIARLWVAPIPAVVSRKTTISRG